MKGILSHIALQVVTLAVPTLTAFAAPDMRPSPVSKILVPNGFDDNDNVEIVLQGYFTNSCAKVGPTSYSVDADTKTITIEATSYTYGDSNADAPFCALVMTPFLQTVRVGMLPDAVYTVKLANNAAPSSTFAVQRRHTEAPDDYLYAPVEDAEVAIDNNGRQSLVVSGTYPILKQGCWVVRDVRVTRDPIDVLVVQPISEIVLNQECSPEKTFKIVKPMSEAFYGEGLLHVRVLSGNSLNRFLNISSQN